MRLLSELVLYGLIFGPNYYFHRGSAVVVGKFNGINFSCLSKSGSQNLWLPILPLAGLKVFHPKGYSGTLERATSHIKAQSALADVGLAPRLCSTELLNLHVSFERASDKVEPWDCYGVVMKRVFNGGAYQIMENLKGFDCKLPDNIADLLVPYGVEALTLRDYKTLCGLLDGNDDRITETINEFDRTLPEKFKGLPDLLTPTNIVLDDKGECKVIDFDLCNV